MTHWLDRDDYPFKSIYYPTLLGRMRYVDEGKRDLLAWGMKDIAFRKKELKRRMTAFPNAKVVRFPEAGHFVPEEHPHKMISEIRKMVGGELK